jgi:hypothetical protein
VHFRTIGTSSQELGYGLAAAWIDKFRSNFRKRYKNEPPKSETRMRHRESRGSKDFASIEYDVQVESAWPFRGFRVTNPMVLSLDLKTSGQ